jgi:hypothetical protein
MSTELDQKFDKILKPYFDLLRILGPDRILPSPEMIEKLCHDNNFSKEELNAALAYKQMKWENHHKKESQRLKLMNEIRGKTPTIEGGGKKKRNSKTSKTTPTKQTDSKQKKTSKKNSKKTSKKTSKK